MELDAFDISGPSDKQQSEKDDEYEWKEDHDHNVDILQVLQVFVRRRVNEVFRQRHTNHHVRSEGHVDRCGDQDALTAALVIENVLLKELLCDYGNQHAKHRSDDPQAQLKDEPVQVCIDS